MSLRSCSLLTQLLSRRYHRWVTFSHKTMDAIRGSDELLRSTHADASYLAVLEMSWDRRGDQDMTHTAEGLSMEEPLLIVLLVSDLILTVIGIAGRSITHHPKWLMCNILGAMLVGLVVLLLSTTRGSPGDGENVRARAYVSFPK